MNNDPQKWRRNARREAFAAPIAHPLGMPDYADRGPVRGYHYPYACFACRGCFRRSGGEDAHVLRCPRCAAGAIRLSRKFKPPPRDDIRQWEKVRALVAAGFVFESVGEPYPDRLSEVAAFAARYAAHLARMRARWPAMYVAIGEALAG